MVAINLLGDAIHNFIDGVLIGASYLAGPRLGVATTVAVLLHEIPQELGDFGILIHSGLGGPKGRPAEHGVGQRGDPGHGHRPWRPARWRRRRSCGARCSR